MVLNHLSNSAGLTDIAANFFLTLLILFEISIYSISLLLAKSGIRMPHVIRLKLIFQAR